MPSITLPKNSAAFSSGATLSRDGKLEVRASVCDDAIRQMGIKHDGYETVDAWIPEPNGQPWRKVTLKFDAEVASGPVKAHDLYSTTVQLTPEEMKAVKSEGVAFDVRLNRGTTLWGQEAGDNTEVSFR